MIVDRELRKKLKELESKMENIRGEILPSGVVLLNNILAHTKIPLDRAEIYLAIVVEFKKAKMFAQEISTLRKYSAEFNALYNDFQPMVTLADRLSYNHEYAIEAAEIINIALSKAREKNEFVRLVLGVKARIARRTDDQHLYSEALSELVTDYETNDRDLDIQFEDDFIKDLPNGFCPNLILNKYLDMRNSA